MLRYSCRMKSSSRVLCMDNCHDVRYVVELVAAVRPGPFKKLAESHYGSNGRGTSGAKVEPRP